jgi:hypothetical protein
MNKNNKTFLITLSILLAMTGTFFITKGTKDIVDTKNIGIFELYLSFVSFILTINLTWSSNQFEKTIKESRKTGLIIILLIVLLILVTWASINFLILIGG